MNELRYFSGVSEDMDAKTIVDNLVNVGMAAMSRDFGHTGLTSKFAMEPEAYNRENESVRKAMLAYCGSKAGLSEITESRHILNAFDNPTFESVYNAIFADALLGVMARTDSYALSIFANIDTVDVGGSMTYEIETKGLPIAQRNSYTANTTFLEGVAKSAITITPKVYSTGSAVDVIRMLKGDIEMGKEIARIAMSMLYAQYNLCVSQIVNNAVITNTPLNRTAFTAANYMLTIDYLQALNNAGVKAYGTLPALNKIGVAATADNYGFTVQDELIHTGVIPMAYGINHIIMQQSTNMASALGTTDALVQANMLLPYDKVFLLADVGDRPVKLVRENYIRVMNKPANNNSLNRREYQYFMSFDAGIATQAHFAIQTV